MITNSWTFGFSIRDFSKRLRELRMPSSRGAIQYWERQGLVKFRRSPGGWRLFGSVDEIDQKIRCVIRAGYRFNRDKNPEGIFRVLGINETYNLEREDKERRFEREIRRARNFSLPAE